MPSSQSLEAVLITPPFSPQRYEVPSACLKGDSSNRSLIASIFPISLKFFFSIDNKQLNYTIKGAKVIFYF